MNEIVSKLRERLSVTNGYNFVTHSEIQEYPSIEIPKERLLEISKILKEELGFILLIDIVGVDRFTKDYRFECIYNLWNETEKQRLFIRVKLDSAKPEVESVTPLWPGANWMEREAFDMFGINFLNHPDLRRIYMIQDYKYYPLRKDYPLMGIPGASELPKK
jgi:NADH-quinone oxidoreductase subunit C